MPLQDRNPDQISVHVQDRLPDISDHGNHALEWLHLLHYKQTNRLGAVVVIVVQIT